MTLDFRDDDYLFDEKTGLTAEDKVFQFFFSSSRLFNSPPLPNLPPSLSSSLSPSLAPSLPLTLPLTLHHSHPKQMPCPLTRMTQWQTNLDNYDSSAYFYFKFWPKDNCDEEGEEVALNGES